MTTRIAAAARPPMGIMAPRPQSVVGSNIAKNQKLEVRPREPVYVYLAQYIEGGEGIAGINKKGPFQLREVRDGEQPAGLIKPRTPGRWVEISVKPGATQKAGATDKVDFVSQWSIGDGRMNTTKTPFSLVLGSGRMY